MPPEQFHLTRARLVEFLKKYPKLYRQAWKMRLQLTKFLFSQDIQQYVSDLTAQLTQARTELKPFQDSIYIKFVPPGHYYSSIPDRENLILDQDRVFSTVFREIPSLPLDAASMRAYLERFREYSADFPFTDEKSGDFRFYLDNGVYSHGDAVVLYSMLRQFKPNRVIEIGSGMSTCLILDVNQQYLNGLLQLTCIDPYPQRMLDLLQPGDQGSFDLIPQRIQDVDLGIFQRLEPGDILFCDSTHVSKADSDVNHLFFDILPVLNPGVLIHFHDIFYPFEYPRLWLLEIGAAWNEAYILKAFLQYNAEFEIVFFSDFLAHFYRGELEANIPVFLKGPGSSIWLRRK